MHQMIEILLVEDDAFDAIMTKKFLQKGSPRSNLHIVQDGEMALNFLCQNGQYRNAPRPDLVLLDIGLPKMDGEQVLANMKGNPKLKNIPVVVLTGQALESSPVKDFNLNESCYLNKWLNMKELTAIIKAIEDYQLTFKGEKVAA